jgi:uncharacterized protein YbjQ (UPF0145 family)
MRPEVIPTEYKKDHYIVKVNDNLVGIFERSELRYLIETIDDAIGSGLRTEIKPEVLEYQKMLAKAKEAALSEIEGDDCLMCGS